MDQFQVPDLDDVEAGLRATRSDPLANFKRTRSEPTTGQGPPVESGHLAKSVSASDSAVTASRPQLPAADARSLTPIESSRGLLPPTTLAEAFSELRNDDAFAVARATAPVPG